MAMAVTPYFIGIDVAKDELVIHHWTTEVDEAIPNTQRAIRAWLKKLPTHSRLALEATGVYHMALAEQAYHAGFTVFIIDGYQLSHYREGLRGRSKTDAKDAQLIARFLVKEGDELRPWSPPPKAYSQLQSLLRRRARVVQARVAIQQSVANESTLKAAFKRLVTQINRLDTLIQKRIRQAVGEAGLTADVARCQAIEGVGPLTAVALVMTFLRGDFRNSDAFIAFLGMDVRVRDSGKQRQRRKLSKRGNPEVRRLLYNAAMAASRSPVWADHYQSYRSRGLKTTEAFVILGRKLARIAFALMKNQTTYQSGLKNACTPT